MTVEASPLPGAGFDGGFEEAEGRFMVDSGRWRVIVSWLVRRVLPSYIHEVMPSDRFVKTGRKDGLRC